MPQSFTHSADWPAGQVAGERRGELRKVVRELDLRPAREPKVDRQLEERHQHRPRLQNCLQSNVVGYVSDTTIVSDRIRYVSDTTIVSDRIRYVSDTTRSLR